MTALLQPATAEEAREAVALAYGEEAPVELVGRGSKRDLGRPLQTHYRLDLSRLSGVRFYEPEELVMCAGPATAIGEIEAMLAERRQQLAFEPADLGPLLGQPAGAGSIGGVFGCNLAGPRRLKAGAARDHLLGIKGVSGRGESFKSGGRVVKNVTGYDLCKLVTGAYGTLAALTEITFKVLPAPESTRTLLLFGLADRAAITAMAAALSSPHEVSAAAHLPAGLAAASRVPLAAGRGLAVTAIRVEGPRPSVLARVAALQADFPQTLREELHSRNSQAFWREIRDVELLIQPAERTIWRLSVPPASGAEVTARLQAAGIDAEWFYDWGGGLIWLAVAGDPAAAAVRAAVAPCGGHAMLVRALAAQRAAIPVFEPQPEPLARLTERVKVSFDPRRILNPGRMYPGV